MKSALRTLVATTFISVLAAVAQAQDITFHAAPDAQIPLEIQLITSRSTPNQQDSVSAYDETGRERLRIQLEFTKHTRRIISAEVKLYNSRGGQPYKKYFARVSEAEQLLAHLRNISDSCPLTIEIDRSTLRIEDVKPACDPYAEVEPAIQNG